MEPEKIQKLAEELKGLFDFSMARKPGVQYHEMQTQFVYFGFDGRRTKTETYFLKLRGAPASEAGKKLDQYVCKEFGLQFNSDRIATIPSLKDWEYEFDLMSAINGGPVFGIPHNVFESLQDDKGNQISPDICYCIYNNFVDFHAFNDAFSRPLFGRGIDLLKHIGDKIVHAAAGSEAPVNLGSIVKPGSIFHNGQVTLECKGVSLVDGKPCALVGYDSGESTLNMTVIYPDGKEVTTIGGSEYKGDMYIDLESDWVRKTTLDEFVVTEAAGKPGYTVRHLLLRLIDKAEFEKEFAAFDPLKGPLG
jgi:hypothetical protein